MPQSDSRSNRLEISEEPKESTSFEGYKRNDELPPDGGWGWMVVIAFSIANVSILILNKSIGMSAFQI